MTQVIELETQEALDALIASGESVVVDFYAEWCGPCKILGKTINETEGLGKIYKANVEVATFPGVRSIPTVIRFEGGEKVASHVGLLNSEELKSFVNNG